MIKDITAAVFVTEKINKEYDIRTVNEWESGGDLKYPLFAAYSFSLFGRHRECSKDVLHIHMSEHVSGCDDVEQIGVLRLLIAAVFCSTTISASTLALDEMG